VLEVALSIGFRSHGTFSRAFRRYFGVSPETFRKNGPAAKRQRLEHYTQWTPDDCVLSSVRYEILCDMPLLALRAGILLMIPAAVAGGMIRVRQIARANAAAQVP